MREVKTSTKSKDVNEFLKWYGDRQNSSLSASVAHSGTPFAGLTHSNSLGPWVLDSGATDHITGNKSFFSSLSTFIYHPLPWPMALGSHPMVLILFIVFLLCLLIMFFMFLGLPLTYYPLVVKLVPLNVLFLLPKILFLYRTRV